MTVAIPKLRQGSCFPSILEPRRRIDQALYVVVMEAYVHGVFTRSVDDLVVTLGGTGISKSEVSRICAGPDEAVGAFRTPPPEPCRLPYVYLDATYLHVRSEAGMVVSKAVVIATGVTELGRREILGLDVGDSEDEVFCRAFLTGLKTRGVGGVKAGDLRSARRPRGRPDPGVQGAGHQRCRVHFIRIVLAQVSNAETEMVAAILGTIFAQPDLASMGKQWDKVAGELGVRFPIAALMDAAKTEVPAFAAFPRALAQDLVQQPPGYLEPPRGCRLGSRQAGLRCF